jgi:hypothetical protein
MFWDGSAVYIDPWFVAAKGVAMYRSGNHFLAGPSLTDDQYGGWMARHLFHQSHHSLQSVTANDLTG